MQYNLKTNKLLHLASTTWLIISFLYVFINALRYWQVKWWVIFSLSGYSLLVLLLLISFYLFAIYNGLVRNKKIEKEHPLTRTSYYMYLYDITPFIGAFAALFAITSADNLSQAFTILAIGTFTVTFLFWIVLDPLLNLIEASLPQSRYYRRRRLELERQEKLMHKQEQEKLICELQEQEKQLIFDWENQLSPLAEKLCDIFEDNQRIDERKIVDIGLKSWQVGGVESMVLLKTKAMDMIKNLKDNNKISTANQLIELNWGGIGDWNAHLNSLH